MLRIKNVIFNIIKRGGYMKRNRLLLVFVLLCTFFMGVRYTNAYTIKEDGKYAIILSLKPVDEGDIDLVEYGKVIKFDLDNLDEEIKLSDITAGINAFNGKNKFAGWNTDYNSSVPMSDVTFKSSDFKSSGDMGDVSYSNGLTLYAIFSNELLKDTGTYYITLDPFAGTINEKNLLRLTSKSSEFKTVDLSNYKPVRKGCTFVGWDYNGTLVTSIDSSYFKNGDAITVTAVYKKDTFEDDDSYVLKLNANGGTIEGESIKKYNYLGGNNSGTFMAIFQYVPIRKGYTFKGWNSKIDGSGKYYKYMYWRNWFKDSEGFDVDTLNDYVYKNLTLYAIWEKDANTEIEKVNVIESNSSTKGNIVFEDGIDKDYKLDIKEVEIKDDLKNKNVKFIVDINVLNNTTVVPISNSKLKISFKLPETLLNYKKYQIVYIKDGEIKEYLPATVKNGYIEFETSHLSEYGVIATNEETIKNPKTSDNVVSYAVLSFISLASLISIIVLKRRKC